MGPSTVLYVLEKKILLTLPDFEPRTVQPIAWSGKREIDV
jgi:hypothetical protein